MLAVARARNPDLPFAAGEVGALPVRPGACAAVVAFYVLHHVPRPDLPATLAGIRRALAPGGTFAFATHEGEGTFEAPGTEIVGTLYAEDELAGHLASAGFRVDAVDHRDSLPHERPGTRIFVTSTALAPTP
jgi:SAM-dependent methyltransferase